MKKIIIPILSALSAVCVFTAVGCTDNGEPQGQTYTVSFVGGEGYSFLSDAFTYDKQTQSASVTVTEGDTLCFSLDVGAFYTGTPTVYAGSVVLSANEDVYAMQVNGDTTVTVNGIIKDSSDMLGTGEMDDAFVVSKPIDLLYIAEQVNSGNERYRSGAYILANDIDCKGEELKIIGDGTPDKNGDMQGFFSGCFSCVTDEASDTMQRYTISNFVINTTDKNYVGLFGCVQADLTNDSSGLFYGIRLADFTINVSADNLEAGNETIYCGSLIGFGVGARAYLCDATNGNINLAADSNYFSYAGGLIGVQQGRYLADYGDISPAEIAYSYTDVDIYVSRGLCLFGGGVSGYILTDSLVAPSFIHNSYALGSVKGAIRAGGIVGGMGQYTSVAGSYATGEIHAKSTQTSSIDVSSPEYCYAYAGGIAGYAENDTIVNDCFFVGKTQAQAIDGNEFAITGNFIAGKQEAYTTSVVSEEALIKNCLSSIPKDDIKATLETTLGWKSFNWVMADDKYPTINYEPSSETVITTITAKNVVKTQNGLKDVLVGKATQTSFSYEDSYAPMVDAFNNGDLSIYLQSDDETLLSFGYFFDEALTEPVPYSYLTIKSVTLYVGFANPADIVGKYTLASASAQSASLEILSDGTATYTDGTSEETITYQYNGSSLILEGARLGRYYNGVVDTDLSLNEDAAFDMNRYIFYYFRGEKDEDGSFRLYDGVYFTKDAPLLAYSPNVKVMQGTYYTQISGVKTNYVFYADGTGYSQGNTPKRTFTYVCGESSVALQYASKTESINLIDLQNYDIFQGTWSKSATVNKFLTFDGVGNWSYLYKTYERNGYTTTATDKEAFSGAYTYANSAKDVLSLTLNGVDYNARIDEMGRLLLESVDGTQVFYRQSGVKGNWTNGNASLLLDGLNQSGKGTATLSYKNGYSFALNYEESETQGYLVAYYDGSVFGYFTYDEKSNAMVATLYDPYNEDSGYTACMLYPVFDYDGEWISNTATLDDIKFLGLGGPNNDGDWESTVTLKNGTVRFILDGWTLDGYFDYNGVRYTVSLNEDTNLVTVTYTDNSGEQISYLQRKDKLAEKQFISILDNGDVISFAFDGKGNLTSGGKLKITYADDTTQTYNYYSIGNDSYQVKDAEIVVGQIDLADNHYVFTVGTTSYKLFVRNELMGKWAINGAFNYLEIGATDIHGNILAKYKGDDVLMSYLDPTTLTFKTKVEGFPETYYVYLINDEYGKLDVITLSQYTDLSLGEYFICTRVDSLYGLWSQTAATGDKNLAISFDGTQSAYNNGVAHLLFKGNPTLYYYKTYEDGSALIWSQSAINGSTLYFQLHACSVTDLGAYVSEDGTRAFRLSVSDSLYKTMAKDANGVTYEFDGNNIDLNTPGTLRASNGDVYTYVVTEFTADKKAYITLTKNLNGETTTYQAVLDYSNPQNVKLTITAAA